MTIITLLVSVVLNGHLVSFHERKGAPQEPQQRVWGVTTSCYTALGRT